MKRIIIFLAMVMTFLSIVSCSTDKPEIGGTADFSGDWQLMDAKFNTKSAVIGGETVTVYLRLSKDGSFGIWQQLGQGRFNSFTGTWSYSKGVLSGIYSDGTKWGSEYEVTLEENFMTMTALPDGLDIYSYSRCTIPESVQSQ
ncbi:MAG: hypothetical protein ACI4UJ_00920 [Candidatus Cryptobacteroides sp.]